MGKTEKVVELVIFILYLKVFGKRNICHNSTGAPNKADSTLNTSCIGLNNPEEPTNNNTEMRRESFTVAAIHLRSAVVYVNILEKFFHDSNELKETKINDKE
jgi:hypothetical protein